MCVFIYPLHPHRTTTASAILFVFIVHVFAPRTFSYSGRLFSKLRRRMSVANLCAMVVGAAFPWPISDAEIMIEYESRLDRRRRAAAAAAASAAAASAAADSAAVDAEDSDRRGSASGGRALWLLVAGCAPGGSLDIW